MSKDVYHDWVKHPIGAIPRGEWCDHCKRHNSRKATCTTLGVKDGKILMILRNTDPQKNHWSCPGGYIDWDETAKQAAMREFKEESGFLVTNLKLHEVYSDPKRDLDGRQNIDVCFIGQVKDKIGSTDAKEVKYVKWFDLNNLPEKIAFDHRQMIEDYKNKIR